MSEFPDPPDLSSRARIRMLASTVADGKAYERWKDVEDEIQKASRLHQSDLITQAQGFQSETLVFFIRQTHRVEKEISAVLLQELTKRTLRLARRWVWGLDRMAVEDIVLKVEMSILELVLSDKSSRQTDFLEIAFAKSVQQRTLDAVKKYKNSTMSHLVEFVPQNRDDDGDEFDEIERPIELAADNRPSQEAIVLQLEDIALARKLIETAYEIAKDPRHVEAAVLRYGHGWPIRSKNGKHDLVTYFNARAAQVKYWSAEGLKALRAAAERLGIPQCIAEVEALEEVTNE
jgi:hypothetical protein